MHSSITARAVATSIACVLVAGVAACSNSSTSAPAATTRVVVGSCHIAVSTDLKVEPTVSIPACPKPSTLQSVGVVTGTGAVVALGDDVTVQYVAVAWSTGKPFSSSWSTGKPVVVTELGQNFSVAMGWNFGLAGTRVGSRQLLVLPPDMAFGGIETKGVSPDETVVDVLDIVSVAKPSP